MTTDTDQDAYYADLTDATEVFKFPEDFADWLREQGREQEAREFLVRACHYVEVTDDEEITLEAIIHIAKQYAPVIDIGEFRNAKSPFFTTLSVLEEVERQEEDETGQDTSGAPSSWDWEEEMERQHRNDAPATPRTTDEPEFPWVHIPYFFGDDIFEVIDRAILALVVDGEERGAAELVQGVQILCRRHTNNLELLTLVMSFVKVLPDRILLEEAKPRRIRARL